MNIPSPYRQKLEETLKKEVIFLKGKTLNIGAGNIQYRELAEQMVCIDAVKFPGIDKVMDFMKGLKFKDNSFDNVLCTNVLEHVSKPGFLVEEIRRVLKKDGQAIIITPFMERFHPDPKDYWRVSEQGLKEVFFKKFKSVKIIKIGNRFTLISTMIHDSFIPTPLKKLFNWFLKKIGNRFQDKNYYLATLAIAKP
ncbi:MAG: class I SAM-dependent methyltransferase [archaeon]